MTSPLGQFVGSVPLLVANLFPASSPPAGPFALPGVQIDVGAMIVLFDGSAPFPFFFQTIGPSGFFASYVVPAGFGGLVLRVQGAAVSTSALNTIVAATDAHEIYLL